jgi:hypothetical protein
MRESWTDCILQAPKWRFFTLFSLQIVSILLPEIKPAAMKKCFFVLSCCFSCIFSTAQTVVLTPLKDNTIFSEDNNASSGAGTDIYAGRTGTNASNSRRRALLQFDLDTIPANAIISSVSLIINCTKVSPFSTGPVPIRLNVALESWGEGGSVGPGGSGAQATNGDATWACRFSNGTGGCSQSWTINGGYFQSISSASVNVNETGQYTIASTAALIADVKRWVDTPSLNFGWILRGDESASAYTVRAFASKEHQLKGAKLTVTYSIPDCNSNTWTGAVSNAWETAGNWSCNMVPNSTMAVVISGGTVELSSNAVVKTLQLSNGANLTAKPGFTLTVLQ